jgi:hypothetical protein
MKRIRTDAADRIVSSHFLVLDDSRCRTWRAEVIRSIRFIR